MKKIQILIVIVICFSSICHSQDWLNDKVNLKGNVKSVYYNSTTYVGEDEMNWWKESSEKHFNNNGFLIKSDLRRIMFGDYQHGIFRKFNKEGTRCIVEYEIINYDTVSVSNFTYDSLGRVEKSFNYNQGVHSSTLNYVYNEKNQISEYFVISEQDKDTNRMVYEYDVFSRMIKQSDISKSCIIIKSWEYDNKGNLIQEKSELKKSPATTVVRVNSDGTREIEKVENFPDDIRNYVITYEYNESNQVIHEIRKYLDNRIQYDAVYTYSKKGLVATKSFLTSECCDDGNAKFEYKFDKHDNWILTSKKGHKILSEVEKRDIEYF
jgi:hypothetical protein